MKYSRITYICICHHYSSTLAMVQEQQCGNQKTSTYKLSPVPSNATNRFWTNFCLHDVLKPSGVSQIPLHGWSASLKTIHFNIIPIIQILFRCWSLPSNTSNIHRLYYHQINDGVYLLPAWFITIIFFYNVYPYT